MKFAFIIPYSLKADSELLIGVFLESDVQGILKSIGFGEDNQGLIGGMVLIMN